MENFDDLFQYKTVQPKFNKADWAHQKNQKREVAYETISKMATEVAINPTSFKII